MTAFYYAISSAMHDVAFDQRLKKHAYLKFGADTSGREYVCRTNTKTDAASLEKLAERFRSKEPGSLGSQIIGECESVKGIGRSHVRHIGELITDLSTMETYLDSHRKKIGFVFLQFLSTCFPWVFSSPEKILSEKLGHLRSIKEFVVTQYQNCPSDRECAIKRWERYAEVSQKSKEEHLEFVKTLGASLAELSAMLRKYRSLKHETLAKAKDGSWERLREIAEPLQRLSFSEFDKSETPVKEKIEQLPQVVAFKGKVPVMLESHIKAAYAYLERKGLLTEEYTQKIKERSEKVEELQALTDDGYLAVKDKFN